jgi:hypothetical protein
MKISWLPDLAVFSTLKKAKGDVAEALINSLN